MFFYPSLYKKHNRKNTNSLPKLNYYDLLEKCNLLTLQERLEYYIISQFHATITFDSKVKQINDLYKPVKENLNSRTKSIIVPTHKSKTYENSVFYQSIILWNSLPIKVKNSKVNKKPESTNFISQLYDWILSKKNKTSINY